ncbi:hypothetical protein [Psychromonas sp. SP041]|uniref:hypothetical protein n=1 Tax=Psychromonas sp. SP041 TaxID=1365007 RepID=UPI00041F4B75|nr:hypothetical protein [Psychromonas sp. SP041]
MTDEVLYQKGKYKLTNESFSYQGHTENLKNIADLEVVEAQFKQKCIAGLTLSFWGLVFSFMPGFLFTVLFSISGVENAQEYISASCMLLFFFLGFMLRAKYTLFITKISGNRGSIDKNRKSREDFDELINQVKNAIFTHC